MIIIHVVNSRHGSIDHIDLYMTREYYVTQFNPKDRSLEDLESKQKSFINLKFEFSTYLSKICHRIHKDLNVFSKFLFLECIINDDPGDINSNAMINELANTLNLYSKANVKLKILIEPFNYTTQSLKYCKQQFEKDYNI